MSTSLRDDSPQRFLFCGIVTAWDPKSGQMQIALEPLWVMSEVACTSLTVGTRIMAIGHRDLEGRRVVTGLRILTG